MRALIEDAQAGVRAMLRSPWLAVPAVTVVAVGTAGGIAIALLLLGGLAPPLAVANAANLVAIGLRSGNTQSMGLPIPLVSRLADLTDVFISTSATVDGTMVIAEVDGAHAVSTVDSVSGDYFQILGLVPARGRGISDEDIQTGASAPVAVVSHRFWLRRLSGDPDALGRNVIVDGVAFRVIGIMGAEYVGLHVELPTDLLIPLTSYSRIRGQSPPYRAPTIATMAIARLRPGVTVEQATQRLTVLWPQLVDEVSQEIVGTSRLERLKQAHIAIRGLSRSMSYLSERYGQLLNYLLVLSCWMLLTASVTVAGLRAARRAAQASRFAVYRAVGAPMARVVRQEAFEGLAFVSVGVSIGIVGGWLGARLLAAILASGLQIPFELGLVIVNSDIALTIAAVWLLMVLIVCGSGAVQTRIQHSGEGAVSTRGTSGSTRLWSRRLIILQTTLSTVLLVSAVLAVTHLRALLNLEPGFGYENVRHLLLWPRPDAPIATHDDFARLLSAVVELPFVDAVALVNGDVGEGSDVNGGYEVRAGRQSDDAPSVRAHVDAVSPGFLETMELKLKEGRGLTWGDTAATTPVALITESLATRLFAGHFALGQSLLLGATENPMRFEIVGVLHDTRLRDLRDRAWHVLVPQTQIGLAREPTLLVRYRPGTISQSGTVAGAIQAAGRYTVARDEPLASQIDRQLVRERLFAFLLTTFSTVASIQIAIGLYAVQTFSLVSRRREIGVRLALGATPRQIRATVVWDSIRMTLLGAALSVPVALLVPSLLTRVLPGLHSTLPITAFIVVTTIVVISSAGVIVPAARASRVQAASALRAE